MNGAVITRALLLRRPQLVALLGLGATGKIFIGVIPAGATLPCFGITEVSMTEHIPLAGGRDALCTARVQITAAAATIREGKDLIAQARYACRNFVGSIVGVPNVKCQLDVAGPDLDHEAGFAMQMQDVRVTFMDVAT